MVEKLKVLLLAAGTGSRLKPYTDIWPKCLMPINKHPLLEYWLLNLKNCGFEEVLINLHYKSEIFDEFLSRKHLKNFVKKIYEPTLLGTAGTIRANSDYFASSPSLIVHADNLISCDLNKFIKNHFTIRRNKYPISLMSFKTKKPEQCGILDIDKNGVVKKMYEKVKPPPGNIANGAVYIFENEVIKYIKDNKSINDISLDLLPKYMGKILSWHNKYVHIDIGSISELRSAQKKDIKIPKGIINDEWQQNFLKNKIHEMIN